MSTQRNIVLVTADSLRADHCGFLGCDHDTTPTLDRMAADGLVFENAVAPGPRTPSSMPVIFTGEYPVTDEVAETDWHDRRQRIGRHLDRHRTFVERLRLKGYTTVGVTVNPWTGRDTGFDIGFDRFSELNDLDMSWPWYTKAFDKVVSVTGRGTALQWGVQKDWFAQWPTYWEELQERLRSLVEPFFLWVFALDPHLPYITPAAHRNENSAAGMWYSVFRYWQHQYRDGRDSALPPGVEKRIRRSYRDTVRSVDALVGRLERETPEDTAILFHADHGEAFMEHGSYGHQRQLYEENLHVPLLGYNLPETGRVSEPATLAKLPAFVEAIATGSNTKTSDGALFMPTTPAAVAQTEDATKTAVRTACWKLIEKDDGVILFNLASDPDEKRDCAADYPNVVAELSAVVKRQQQSANERRDIRRAVETLGEIE